MVTLPPTTMFFFGLREFSGSDPLGSISLIFFLPPKLNEWHLKMILRILGFQMAPHLAPENTKSSNIIG